MDKSKELHFTKASDHRYESTDGNWAFMSDFSDAEDWHILDGDDKVVAAANGDLEAVKAVVNMLSGKTVYMDQE